MHCNYNLSDGFFYFSTHFFLHIQSECSHNTDPGHSLAFKAELIMVIVVTILILVTVRLLRQN